MQQIIDPFDYVENNVKKFRRLVVSKVEVVDDFLFGNALWHMVIYPQRWQDGIGLDFIFKCKLFDPFVGQLKVDVEMMVSSETFTLTGVKQIETGSEFKFGFFKMVRSMRDDCKQPFLVIARLEIENPDFFPPRFNYSNQEDVHGNILFVLGEHRIKYNKAYLANLSTKLYNMVTELEEIAVTDIELNEFIDFLNVIGPTRKAIDNVNVLDCLKMAREYELEPIVKKCEQILIEDNTRFPAEKLGIAGEYQLRELGFSVEEEMREARKEHLLENQERADLTIKIHDLLNWH